jgi:hypothetical protein
VCPIRRLNELLTDAAALKKRIDARDDLQKVTLPLCRRLDSEC